MTLWQRIFYRPATVVAVGFSPVRWPWEGRRWRQAEAELDVLKGRP